MVVRKHRLLRFGVRYNKDITFINNLLYYVLMVSGVIYGIVTDSPVISIISLVIPAILHFSILVYILNPLTEFIADVHIMDVNEEYKRVYTTTVNNIDELARIAKKTNNHDTIKLFVRMPSIV